MRCPFRTVLRAAAPWLLVACGASDAAPRRMALKAIRPLERSAVYLNEELVLVFSHEVDPTSISGESLAILADDGTRARGRWTVTGRQVRFRPEPVLSRALDDGGYRPGTSYTVHVVGFPRLDGLRATSGVPLERSLRWRFTTVSIDKEPRGFVFDDVSPEQLVWPGIHLDREQIQRPLAPGEPIRLLCNEPLDPSTLFDDDFWVEQVTVRDEVVRAESGEVRVVREPRSRRIDVRGTFVANHHQGEGANGVCAVIELLPLEVLEPGPEHDYYFHAQRSLRLTDFHGNTRPLGHQTKVAFRVGRVSRTRGNRLTLSFLDRSGFIAVQVPGSDGTAHWSDSGLLEVRYPAAAGGGEHGRLESWGPAPSVHEDLRGTRVDVPAGEVARLASGRGLRIVRAQGRLSVAGELVRELDGPFEGPEEAEQPFLPGETLSAWIERAQREEWDWTVLVAGGDLVVEGALRIDTPLLLVAGGWIRVLGSARACPGHLWLAGEGGGNLEGTASVAPLLIDPPRENLLRETVRFSVVTSPLPSQRNLYRWRDVRVDGRAGSGTFQVRFLPRTGPVDPSLAVGHPRHLAEPGQLRLLLDLVVPPGHAWDPPIIDTVELFWELAD